jgi:hypothetical protein
MTLAAIVIALVPVTLTLIIVPLSIVGAIRCYLRWLAAT